jgi:hypothetical protein
MTEDQIGRAADTMVERITLLLGAYEITLCQAADRCLLVQQWTQDRRLTAGLSADAG